MFPFIINLTIITTSTSRFINLGPTLTRKLIETEHPDFDSPSPFTKAMTMHNKLIMMGLRQHQVALFCSNELKTENAELVLPPGSIFMHYGSKVSKGYVGRRKLVSPSIRQPSLKMAWNCTTTEHACALVSNLPNNYSDWPVSMYSVKTNRHAPCTMPHCAMRCIALRESLTHWSVVSMITHVYLCAHF